MALNASLSIVPFPPPKSAKIGNLGFKEEQGTGTVDLRSTKLETNAKWVIGIILNTPSNIEISASLASKLNVDIFSEIPPLERDFSISYRNPWTLYYRLPSKIEFFHEEGLDDEDVLIIEDGIKYTIKLKIIFKS